MVKMFTIFIVHPETRERLKILGQGHGFMEALQDAAKTAAIPFRPKSDGQLREAGKFNVTKPDGTIVCKTAAEFDTGMSL